MTARVAVVMVVVVAVAAGTALWMARDPSSGAAPAGLAPTTEPVGGPRRPPVGAAWQYQLSGPLDLDVDAEVFDVDGDETSADDIAHLHARGAYVVCYISAGTFEEWRDDASAYPDDVLGRPLDDWPGERWVDVRRTDVLLPIIEDRLARCAAKGFDAVELDNVDGYTHDTGFDLSAADQIAFDLALAAAAHRAGLAVGLKNSAELVVDLVDAFDFAVVEECIAYDECDRYVPFVEADKAVFLVEYGLEPDEVCPRARALGFSAIVKRSDLGAPVQPCPRS